MPQWFEFLGLDNKEIDERLSLDLLKYHHYFIGVTLALTGAMLDTIAYYLIRKVGMKVPTSLIPFMSGSLASVAILLFSLFITPFDLGYLSRDFTIDGASAG